jgi:predicted N-acetyltransferase YhbS
MTISIRNFIDCPAALPLVACWIHDEFWADKPGAKVEGMLERISQGRRAALPIGLVAFDGEEPVGTVSLIDSGLDECAELSPWLAALYVVPETRRKGVGEQLVNACLDAAQKCGFQRVYLQTSIAAYYEALGWQWVRKVGERGVEVLGREVAR